MKRFIVLTGVGVMMFLLGISLIRLDYYQTKYVEDCMNKLMTSAPNEPLAVIVFCANKHNLGVEIDDMIKRLNNAKTN